MSHSHRTERVENRTFRANVGIGPYEKQVNLP